MATKKPQYVTTTVVQDEYEITIKELQQKESARGISNAVTVWTTVRVKNLNTGTVSPTLSGYVPTAVLEGDMYAKGQGTTKLKLVSAALESVI